MAILKRHSQRVGLFALTFLVLLGGAGAASAQPDLPALVQLSIVEVRPDMIDEFRSVQKEFAAQEKEAGTPFRAVWQTAQLGATWRFIIATPLDGYGELGAPLNLDQASIDRVVKCIVSRRSVAVTPLMDLTKPLPAGQAPKLAVTRLAKVSPGRNAEYVSWLETDFLPHFDKMGLHYLSGAFGLGGSGEYINFLLFDDFDEIAKGSPVRRSLGEEGAAAVTAKTAGIVADVETWVMSYQADLSYDARGSN